MVGIYDGSGVPLQKELHNLEILINDATLSLLFLCNLV
jgi:hypothetical protein